MKKISAEEFNKKYPVGTKVVYFSVPGAAGTATETRSEAWDLGHSCPVVQVKGKAGGVSLGAIEVFKSAICEGCGRPFSEQEARCGFTICEHCERKRFSDQVTRNW